MGKLLFPPAVCGVDEETSVETTGLLVELQAVNINSPNKLLSAIFNVFVISTDPSTDKSAHSAHNIIALAIIVKALVWSHIRSRDALYLYLISKWSTCASRDIVRYNKFPS